MGGPGSGGHNRKPDWERALDGTRARRKPTAIPLVPLPAGISPARYLSSKAKQYFRELAPQLIEMGTLDEINLRIFEALCSALARVEDMGKILDAEGEVTPGGKVHPLWRAYIQEQAAALTLAKEFGMTPASRARLGIAPKPKEVDPMEALFNECLGKNQQEDSR